MKNADVARERFVDDLSLEDFRNLCDLFSLNLHDSQFTRRALGRALVYYATAVRNRFHCESNKRSMT